MGAGEFDDLHLVLFASRELLHGVGGGGVVERVVAGDGVSGEVVFGCEPHLAVVARVEPVYLCVVGVSQADDPVFARLERRQQGGAAFDLVFGQELELTH